MFQNVKFCQIKKVTEYVTLFRFCPKFFGRKKRSGEKKNHDDLQLESTPSRGFEVADIWYN